MLAFIVGLMIGIFLGIGIFYNGYKDNLKKRLIPFLDASGSVSWISLDENKENV